MPIGGMNSAVKLNAIAAASAATAVHSLSECCCVFFMIQSYKKILRYERKCVTLQAENIEKKASLDALSNNYIYGRNI